MDEERPGRSPVELARDVWSRRKWLAIVVFGIPMTATLSLVLFLPGLYRSTVTVLVDRQQIPETFVRATVTSALETRLQTISQEILSRSRLDSLIARFGLYTDLRQRISSEEVLERMRRDIQLELRGVEQKDGGQRVTVAFALSYRGRDPQTVAQVANTLASYYIEENLKARERQATGTAEFLKARLAEIQARLDQQEGVLRDFKKRSTGELPQQLDTNLATIERLNAQLQSNGDNQARALERRDALLKQLDDAGEAGAAGGASPTGPAALEDQLDKLNQELVRFRAAYSDKYPDVVRLREEIAAIERELSQKSSEPPKESKPAVGGRSPYVLRTRQALADVEGEVKILKNQEKRFRSAIAAYLGRVESAPKREQEFKELSRDYDTTRELYATLLKRYEEAQLAESMEQRQKGEQFRILDSAVPAQDPAAPNRPRLILMGLALSLALAVGAVVAAEQLNAAFHSVDDLRAFTSVPVLVSIPQIVTPTDVLQWRRRTRFATVIGVVGLLGIVGASYYIAHGNEHLVSLLPGRS